MIHVIVGMVVAVMKRINSETSINIIVGTSAIILQEKSEMNKTGTLTPMAPT